MKSSAGDSRDSGEHSLATPLWRGLDGFRAFAGRLELYDFGRWLALATLVGVVTGFGAALLTLGIEKVASFAIVGATGFLPPGSGHPWSTVWAPPQRPWLFLAVLPVAGLIVGFIVQRFAPEAEGHGTDSVIKAFHRERSLIRRRVPIVKMIASVLTIGSGGSAGREGPVAQIGAGFASYVAGLLGLTVRDRRILVLAGVAGGIGGMFRAPLGGAIFAIEVLYSENDFESEALVPAVIASIISYVVNNVLTGWEAVFSTPKIAFTRPEELLPYLLLGVVLAMVARVYIWVFYGLKDHFFARLPVPVWTRPAVGGLLLGALALALPQVLGGGYGWLQLTLDGQLPYKLLLILVPAKILATALTISSGGSGGVFAPSLVIGGVTGAVFAHLSHAVIPNATPDPAACTLVGMGAFFAGAAKVPIASLIMVSEMTGSYRLLVPLMLAGTVAFLLTRGTSIYDQQVRFRVDSPAHVGEFEVDVLQGLKVGDVASTASELQVVRPSTSFASIADLVSSSAQDHFPVVDDDGRLVAIFTIDDVRAVMATPEIWPALVAADLGVSGTAIVYLSPADDLHTAIRTFAASGVRVLPVLAGPPPSKILGFVSHRDVLKAYDGAVREMIEARGVGAGAPPL